jgi:hypothetical protein
VVWGEVIIFSSSQKLSILSNKVNGINGIGQLRSFNGEPLQYYNAISFINMAYEALRESITCSSSFWVMKYFIIMKCIRFLIHLI